MPERQEYDAKIFTGATPEDCKVIHLALSKGEKLTIDSKGRILTDDRRWIADGKPRTQ